MNLQRAVLFLAAVAIVAAVPVTSEAVCAKKITTYWGYDHGGHRCNAVLYPPGNPIVVGEHIIDCDRTVIQWGLTCTDYIEPTVTYEECPEQCSLTVAEEAHEEKQ